MARGEGERRSTDSHEGFRWRCPFCGESRVNVTDDEENAVVALKTHVAASDGGGHGPVDGFPAGVDASALTERVVRVDGPESPNDGR